MSYEGCGSTGGPNNATFSAFTVGQKFMTAKGETRVSDPCHFVSRMKRTKQTFVRVSVIAISKNNLVKYEYNPKWNVHQKHFEDEFSILIGPLIFLVTGQSVVSIYINGSI